MVPSDVAPGGCPAALEIDTNHSYKAGELGVLWFRLRNEGGSGIRRAALSISFPLDLSGRQERVFKSLPPAGEKGSDFRKVHINFIPELSGEAILTIRLGVEGEAGSISVYQGEISLIIAEKSAANPPTSFHIDIHDIEKFMGNDLSGLLTLTGQQSQIDAQSLHAWLLHRKPFWMQVDLELDEEGTGVEREKHDITPRQQGQAISREIETDENIPPKTIQVKEVSPAALQLSSDTSDLVRFLARLREIDSRENRKLGLFFERLVSLSHTR